jgi:hypothetical protein
LIKHDLKLTDDKTKNFSSELFSDMNSYHFELPPISKEKEQKEDQKN